MELFTGYYPTCFSLFLTCKRLCVFLLDNSFHFWPVNLLCSRIVLLVLVQDHLHAGDVVVSISRLIIVIIITLQKENVILMITYIHIPHLTNYSDYNCSLNL